MKLINKEEAIKRAQELRKEGKKVVFTNGCFDILHAGHVRYLAAARHLGDCLFVGLNSDCSVRLLKGPTRPVNNEADRAEVLAALSAVDYVILFPEQTAESLVREVKPNIYVKGGDYTIDDIPEAKVVAPYGGKTIIIPAVEGKSSTNIINKINAQLPDCEK